MGGFSNEVNTFVVSSLEETLDIKLTPNPVDISWVSFENLSVAQIGTTDQADATGTLVVKVPLDQQDNVKQILSTMVVKNSTNSVTINVTPPTKEKVPEEIKSVPPLKLKDLLMEILPPVEEISPSLILSIPENSKSALPLINFSLS